MYKLKEPENKVSNIKITRELFGWGLKEAKNVIDEIYNVSNHGATFLSHEDVVNILRLCDVGKGFPNGYLVVCSRIADKLAEHIFLPVDKEVKEEEDKSKVSIEKVLLAFNRQLLERGEYAVAAKATQLLQKLVEDGIYEEKVDLSEFHIYMIPKG